MQIPERNGCPWKCERSPTALRPYPRYVQGIEKPSWNCGPHFNFAGVPAMNHNLRRTDALSRGSATRKLRISPREIVAPIVSASPPSTRPTFSTAERFNFLYSPNDDFTVAVRPWTVDGSAMLWFFEHSVNNASPSTVTRRKKSGISRS